jgi:hypothetical protein
MRRCQVSGGDADEETRASSRRRLPACMAVGRGCVIDRRGIAIIRRYKGVSEVSAQTRFGGTGRGGMRCGMWVETSTCLSLDLSPEDPTLH